MASNDQKSKDYAPPSYPPPGQQQPQQYQPQYQASPYEQQQQYQAPPYEQPTYASPTYAAPPTQPVSATGSSGAAATTASGKVTMRDRFYQWSTKIGVPVNKLTNRLGSEAFWPSSLDLESDKAARILKSFTHDGFYTKDPAYASTASAEAVGPKKEHKALVKIPAEVIKNAAGIAIFTVFRSGLHISGAGGSGVIVARLPDGGWSPPSGFLVHTLGAGFLVGLDIYDCVCVLRTPEAVKAFTNPRISLGGEIGLVAGPIGAGGSVEGALAKSSKPIYSYMKSRGFYAGIQADGTIIVARPDANADLYQAKGITVAQILNGQVPPPAQQSGTTASGVPPWPVATRHLMEVLKSAEGRKDVNVAVLREVSEGPTPGDLGLAEGDKEVHVPASEKKA